MLKTSEINVDLDKAKDIKVSVIVPAYNEEATILNCLKALTEQTKPPHEVLVVDNKSTDKTSRLVEEFIKHNETFPVKLLHQEEFQGLIPTRNYGFERATGDVFGRIDADSIARQDWVLEVSKAFSDDRVYGATGSVVYYDMPFRRFGAAADKAFREAVLRINKDYDYLFGSNMAISAKAWEIIGDEACLDRKDVMHEDIDLSIHLVSNNLQLAFCKDMVVGMSARRIKDNPKDYKRYVDRFRNTYGAHGMNSIGLKIPPAIFLTIYFPIHALYKPYSKHYNKKPVDLGEVLWHPQGEMAHYPSKLSRRKRKQLYREMLMR
jgi:glycosyltransferase involved in cell wall biosynthesis